ncbi:MAG: lysine--tRNA ligase [Candidatus Levybacteria bacterium RBG_16_35_11]|nr:MAG: lysine--tRNA ligase [Candidatus Levybacteria bacterium RBG_16_35_11]
MFWADELLKNRKGKELINDAWTPSGMVHMGGVKGPVIHDVIYKVLKQKKTNVKYTFGFDDFDPIDGLPPNLQKSHQKYLGVPISIAPSPDGSGSFGDYFGDKMLKLFSELNIEAEIYKTSQEYKKGIYDKAIKFVLDNVDKIRKVYEEINQKKMFPTWFPFQVICPKCGKLGTTRVTAWDGKEVTFICEPQMVTWAKGCGTKGKMSPLGGNGKMPFKVEWAAKWWTYGVTIEGAGKDHASAGGTYDVARKICKDVFRKEPPLKLPYEHFLSGGKKMASSKGVGLSAEELLEVIPSQMVRFLMIKTKPNQAVEFSPKGTDLFPKLYDEYQKAERAYVEKSDDNLARAFELSQTDGIKVPISIRFTVLSQWVQMPNMEEVIKREGLENWAKYARVWVQKYAPDEEKFQIQKELPKKTDELSQKQKDFLGQLIKELKTETNPEEIQTIVYNLAKEMKLSSKDAFAAIYVAFIGKDHGPKAGWLLSSLEKEFIIKRLNEASK